MCVLGWGEFHCAYCFDSLRWQIAASVFLICPGLAAVSPLDSSPVSFKKWYFTFWVQMDNNSCSFGNKFKLFLYFPLPRLFWNAVRKRPCFPSSQGAPDCGRRGTSQNKDDQTEQVCARGAKHTGRSHYGRALSSPHPVLLPQHADSNQH